MRRFCAGGRALLPGRVDLDCPWISGVLLLADNGFAPACVGEAGGLFCLNAWHVEAQKLLPCWGSVAGELPQLSANECRRVARSRVCNNATQLQELDVCRC